MLTYSTIIFTQNSWCITYFCSVYFGFPFGLFAYVNYFFLLFFFVPPNNTPSFLNRKPSNSFSKECIPNCKHCSEHHLWPLLCAVLLSLFSIIWNIRFVLLNPRAIFKCINFTREKKCPHYFSQQANK